MSMEPHVCWQGELTFDRSQLEGALAALGFASTVLHDFHEADGFWPVDIAGCKTGVEIYLENDLEALREDYPELASALGGRDKGATFRWGGDAAECATGLALAAALARLGDVVIYEPSEGVSYSETRAADEARNMFKIAEKEGYRGREP